MDCKKYITKILNSGDMNKVEEMSEYIEYIIDMVGDRELEKVEQKLYEIAEGKMLNEDMAKEIIDKMKPYGMKWSLTDTEGVRNSYGYSDIRPVDFWIVMNSAYNDYHDLFEENVEWYAKFSKDFIIDPDAIDEKVYCYFIKIPKDR